MKLAAIDIGSNAARLLISESITDAQGKTRFNKLNLVRVPLRLGFDVFDTQTISPEKTEHILKTIKAYRALIDVYGVNHYLACATSAMRDAKNSAAIIDRIKAETGVEIKVISGDEEASFIYENHIAENPLNTEKPNATGTVGLVPSYGLVDVNAGYRFNNHLQVRVQVNNLGNKQYFTKRPSFYPGPGIWPSDGRNMTVTAEIRL